MLRAKHRYELKVIARSGEIAWATYNPQQAFRWFAETLASKQTIDTGERVSYVALYRDGELVKDQELAAAASPEAA